MVQPPPEPEPEPVQVIPEVEIDLDVEPMIVESEDIYQPITSTADLLEVIIPEEELDEDVIRSVSFPSTRIFHNLINLKLVLRRLCDHFLLTFILLFRN